MSAAAIIIRTVPRARCDVTFVIGPMRIRSSGPDCRTSPPHVDFSGVFEAARAAGLTLLGYADQAGFLLGAGFAGIYEERLRELDIGSPSALALSAEAKRLTLPQAMGEQFKCIAFGRNYDRLSAFVGVDQSRRLVA